MKTLKTNKSMSRLLNDINMNEMNVLSVEMAKLNELLNPGFVSIQDCILISKKTSQELFKSFDTAVKLHTNRTRYEASNTDTRVNDFFDNDISEQEALAIGLLVIDIWGLRLKEIDPISKFFLIIACSDGYVTLRYHKVRADECNWLDEDIHSYEDAVGYIII